MKIRLKRKYTHRSPYKKSRSDPNGNSGKAHHNKLSQEAIALLPKQPLMAMVVEFGGHHRMIRIG
jgi:hypothetical protein